MKGFLVFVKLLTFWLLFFIFQQILFLSFNADATFGNAEELLKSFGTSLVMNISTATYLSAIPALFLIAGYWGVPDRLIRSVFFATTLLFLILCSIILCTDISLYQVWGTKINAKALGYLKYPKELAPTVFNTHNLFLFIVIIAQIILGLMMFRKFAIHSEKTPTSLSAKILFSLLIPAVLILGFRGGWQRVPINRNWVFQSGHSVLNYGALNSSWNLVNLFTHPISEDKNPYLFFDSARAELLVNELFPAQSGSQEQILLVENPNVVLIFLESWAADVMECLGGERGVTPKFSELAGEGLLFTNFYSTGYRTEQGYLATLSSTPALPVGSVIHSFGSFDKLPNLYTLLNEHGYTTSFYSGGRLFFDNIEAYLKAAGVQTMKGENEWSFPRRTVWGAYDEDLFQFHLSELNKEKQPFFSVATTMTTHEWFEADVPAVFTSDKDPVNDRYRNTMHYADSCLFAYLRAASTQSWYKNTLFIIVADHACKFPKGRENFESERHHIPLLLMGGALKTEYRGKSINAVGSHTDLAATLLGQLGIQTANRFPFSRNILDTASKGVAYYAFDNGFGMITQKGSLVYDHNRTLVNYHLFKDSAEASHLCEQGKAYLQLQFEKIRNMATAKRN